MPLVPRLRPLSPPSPVSSSLNQIWSLRASSLTRKQQIPKWPNRVIHNRASNTP